MSNKQGRNGDKESGGATSTATDGATGAETDEDVVDPTVFYWDEATQSYYTWDSETRTFWKWDDNNNNTGDDNKNQDSGSKSMDPSESIRSGSNSSLLTPEKGAPRRRVTFSATGLGPPDHSTATVASRSGGEPAHARLKTLRRAATDSAVSAANNMTRSGSSRTPASRSDSSQPSLVSSEPQGPSSEGGAARSPRFFAASHSIHLFSSFLDRQSSLGTLPSSSIASDSGDLSDHNTDDELFPVPLDTSRNSGSGEIYGAGSTQVRSNNNLGRFLSFGKHGGLQGCIRLAHADRLSRSLARSNSTIQDANALHQLRKAQLLLQKSGLPIEFLVDRDHSRLDQHSESDEVTENVLIRRNTQPACTESYPNRFSLLSPCRSGSSTDSANLVRRDTLRDVFSNASRRKQFARSSSGSQVRTGPEKQL